MAAALSPGAASADFVLFDFDNAGIHSPLPIDVTVSGLTAHLSGGYSIQSADVMGFTPAGFAGLCVYPSGVFASDLAIAFSEPLSDASLLYAPQELGCDDSALMRITGFLSDAEVATATAKAPSPGTWPTGTLALSAAGGFDRLVIHYETQPQCGDWGPIFMADNLLVAPQGRIFADGFE